MLRVAEKRHVTQRGFWGQPHADPAARAARPRDLPAFWSLPIHGQPFHDERLTHGAANVAKVAAGPPPLDERLPPPAGPATECLATLKSSLQQGFALFQGDSRLSPLPMAPGTLRTLRTCVIIVLSPGYYRSPRDTLPSRQS